MTLSKILKLSLAITACLFIDYVFIAVYFSYHAPLAKFDTLQYNLQTLAERALKLETVAGDLTMDSNTALFSLPCVGEDSKPLPGFTDTAQVSYSPVAKTVSLFLRSFEKSSRKNETVLIDGISSFSYSKIADLGVFEFSAGGRSFSSSVYVNTAFQAAGDKHRMLTR